MSRRLGRRRRALRWAPLLVDHPAEARAIAHARVVLSSRDEPDVELFTERLRRVMLVMQVARVVLYICLAGLAGGCALWIFTHIHTR